jgi:hypothetical protein
MRFGVGGKRMDEASKELDAREASRSKGKVGKPEVKMESEHESEYSDGKKHFHTHEGEQGGYKTEAHHADGHVEHREHGEFQGAKEHHDEFMGEGHEQAEDNQRGMDDDQTSASSLMKGLMGAGS